MTRSLGIPQAVYRDARAPATFQALGVTEDRRTADPDMQPTAGFKAIMREAAETRSYAAALSVLVVAEWLYLDWAFRAPQPLPVNFVHAEWITLHDNPGFAASSISCGRSWTVHRPRARGSVPRLFQRAVALELSFSEAAYPTGPDIDVFDRVKARARAGPRFRILLSPAASLRTIGSDTTFADAIARFGEQGIVELGTIVGYYTAIGNALNIFQVPLPAGAPQPFPK
jgi:hypothetical protein